MALGSSLAQFQERGTQKWKEEDSRFGLYRRPLLYTKVAYETAATLSENNLNAGKRHASLLAAT